MTKLKRKQQKEEPVDKAAERLRQFEISRYPEKKGKKSKTPTKTS